MAPDGGIHNCDIVDIQLNTLDDLFLGNSAGACSCTDADGIGNNNILGIVHVQILTGDPAGAVKAPDLAVHTVLDHADGHDSAGGDFLADGLGIVGSFGMCSGSGLGNAGEGVSQDICSGSHIQLVVLHVHLGVGQQDPAFGGTAPLVAVDELDLVDVNMVAVSQSANDGVIGTGFAADVQIACAVDNCGSHYGRISLVGVGSSRVILNCVPVGVAQSDPAQSVAAFICNLAPQQAGAHLGGDDTKLITLLVAAVGLAGDTCVCTAVQSAVGNGDGDVDFKTVADVGVAADQNPAGATLQTAPAVALGIDVITVHDHIGIGVGADVLGILGIVIDIGGSQQALTLPVVDDLGIGVGNAGGLPAGIQSLFILVSGQMGNPDLLTVFLHVPAQEDLVLQGRHRSGNGVQVLVEILSVTAVGAFSHSGIGIFQDVVNVSIVAGSNIGVCTVQVHIGLHHTALLSSQLPGAAGVVTGGLADGIQESVAGETVLDGALQHTAAAQPGSAAVVGQHDQSVELILRQGETGRIDSALQLSQLGTQSLVGLLLADGVHRMISALLGTDGAVTVAPFGAVLLTFLAIILHLL